MSTVDFEAPASEAVLEALAGSLRERNFDVVIVKDGAEIHVIPVAALDYVEAQDDYVALHAGGKTWLKAQTLAEVAQARKNGQLLIGFAAETNDMLAQARQKLIGKGLDAYVAVDASGTFSETKRQAGLLRMLQAGVILSDYATLMVEILKDNARPEAGAVYGAMDMPWAKLVGQIVQAYGK